MKNSNVYALLISVGDYEAIGLKNLPTYKGDPVLLGTSLTLGLNVPQDQIRIISGDERPGFVRTATFARAIGEMKSQLGGDDTFILYFSGHGKTERASNVYTPSSSASIVLSDGEIELQSVIDYMDHIPAGAKIVILDCCYSGGFQGAGPRRLDLDSAVSEFAGKGIAIIASSSADEIARVGPGGEYSVFTIMLAHSIVEGHTPLQEKVSLADVYGSMMEMMGRWNAENPSKQQHPIFRSSIGGTIYFPLREYAVKESATKLQGIVGQDFNSNLTNTAYRLYSFKPLDNASEKRIAVFVVVEENSVSPQSLSQITREIAERAASEQDVIWCYFGYDTSDIRRGLHVAYTIWCRGDALRAKYYRNNRNASVVEGIYVFQNNSYAVLKDMQRPVKAHEVIEADYKKLLALIVTEAEKFVYDLQEVRNRIMSNEEMRASYGSWISRVKSLYIHLSEEEAAPDDLYDWTEAIMDLAGWVVDLAVLFEANRTGTAELRDNERWLIDHSIRRYYEALEKLKNM